MHIDLEKLSTNKVYHILTQAIVPRPVAWVLSENENGTHNLAPFSYFNGVSSNPPIIMLSVGNKPDGTQKDTWANIEHRTNFILHIANRELATAVTDTSRNAATGESELESLNLETVEFPGSNLPRIAKCPVAFLCKRHSIHIVGNSPQAIILGEITAAYIDDSVGHLDDKQHLHIDPKKLDPIARLGGDFYSTLGDILNIPRAK